MKRKRRIRGSYSFVLTLLTALAFVVGAVRFWSVPGNEVTRALVAILALLAGLIFLALLTVASIKLIRRWLER